MSVALIFFVLILLVSIMHSPLITNKLNFDISKTEDIMYLDNKAEYMLQSSILMFFSVTINDKNITYNFRILLTVKLIKDIKREIGRSKKGEDKKSR